MDAATALIAQEDAPAVRMLAEMIPPRPPRPTAAKEVKAGEFRVHFPSLGSDPLAFFLADMDNEFPAAIRTAVAIPVLEYRQMTDRPGHDGSNELEFCSGDRSRAVAFASRRSEDRRKQLAAKPAAGDAGNQGRRH